MLVLVWHVDPSSPDASVFLTCQLQHTTFMSRMAALACLIAHTSRRAGGGKNRRRDPVRGLGTPLLLSPTEQNLVNWSYYAIKVKWTSVQNKHVPNQHSKILLTKEEEENG